MEVVEWLTTGIQNISEKAKKYSVEQKRAREWDDKYDQLLNCNPEKGKVRGSFILVVNCAAKNWTMTYLFLEEERSEGRVMRNIDIKEKALELARTLRLHNSWPRAGGSLHGRNAGM